jgi:hypothetical protein
MSSRSVARQWGTQQSLALLAALADADRIDVFIRHHEQIRQMGNWYFSLSKQQQLLQSSGSDLVDALCKAAVAALPLIPQAVPLRCCHMIETPWMLLTHYMELGMEVQQQQQQQQLQQMRSAMRSIISAAGG